MFKIPLSNGAKEIIEEKFKDKEFLTLQELCSLLSVSYKTAYRYTVIDSKIPFVKIKGKILIPKSKLIEVLEESYFD